MKSCARAVALEALLAFERECEHADVLVQKFALKLPDPARDRALLMGLVFGVVRHASLLDHWIEHLRKGALDATTHMILRLGLYQILLTEIPPHAAVNETVNLAGRARGLVNAVLRRALRERELLLRERSTLPMAIQFSHPEHLVKRWFDQHGPENTRRLLMWNNDPAPICGRVNELKVTRETFLNESDGFPRPHPFHKLAMEFETLPHEAIERGWVYLQDPSTLLAVDLLDPQPMETVLDACAAPGGKTSALAACMQNQGRIVATDSIADRNFRLMENLERLGVTNTEVLRHDWLRDNRPERDVRFDRVLVDAPCSNTGVFRRRVDARWRLKLSSVAAMAAIQEQLIEAIAPLVKEGGCLVYSTCSLEPEENAQRVERFLITNPNWRLEKEVSSIPYKDGVDGAYAARLRREA